MSDATETYRTGEGARWYFWDGGFLGVGRAQGIVAPHSHHALQLVVGTDRAVRLKHAAGDWLSYDAVLVAPDEVHSFDPSGAVCVMLLIDPETHEGRWLKESATGPVQPMLAGRVAAAREAVQTFLAEPPDAAGTTQFVDFIVRQFCTGLMPRHTIDERIASALEQIRGLDAVSVSLEDVAGRVFLSPSRFAHLFTDEVGIPFRRYLLWRRLTRAMVLVSRGQTLSRAAHAAGFADSAHLTRTFNQMFGIPPTAMLKIGMLHEIPAPFQLATTARD